MLNNLNFSLRKNGVVLLFIIFIVSIILIVLVNGWILRQIEQKDEEKVMEPSRNNRSEGIQSSEQNQKNIHQIPLDSEILIQ